jgi:hypothetical protein
MQGYPSLNGLHDTIEIHFHFPVIEAQKPDTQFFQLPLPEFIFFPFKLMAFAVDFHGEHQITGEEIQDVSGDWLLPLKTETFPLAAV